MSANIYAEKAALSLVNNLKYKDTLQYTSEPELNIRTKIQN